MNHRHVAALSAILLLSAGTLRAGQTMNVQVRSGQLRSDPSFLGRPMTALNYGDQVDVSQKKGEWMEVRTASGATGWIHQSALTTKKIKLQAGSSTVGTSASGEELALAGKGFNSDVEADFKNKNKDVDFTWIDRMEKIKVNAQESARFLADGSVKPTGGGAP
jgi:SH3-like domain-containing protein